MEFIVIDCAHCGGWCCKSLNCSGMRVSYWKPLTKDEVKEVNPWMPTTMDLEKNSFCNCKHLNEQGLCDYYAFRSEECRQYPNLEFFYFEYLSGDALLYVPWCTYRSIILQSLNKPFELLRSGEECRQKYLQKIRENPETANNFHGKEMLLKQSYEINQSNRA